MLAVVFALSAVVVAPASAKLTKHQKAHIRKQQGLPQEGVAG
jgi:hypothetical protein